MPRQTATAGRSCLSLAMKRGLPHSKSFRWALEAYGTGIKPAPDFPKELDWYQYQEAHSSPLPAGEMGFLSILLLPLWAHVTTLAHYHGNASNCPEFSPPPHLPSLIHPWMNHKTDPSSELCKDLPASHQTWSPGHCCSCILTGPKPSPPGALALPARPQCTHSLMPPWLLVTFSSSSSSWAVRVGRISAWLLTVLLALSPGLAYDKYV